MAEVNGELWGLDACCIAAGSRARALACMLARARQLLAATASSKRAHHVLAREQPAAAQKKFLARRTAEDKSVYTTAQDNI